MMRKFVVFAAVCAICLLFCYRSDCTGNSFANLILVKVSYDSSRNWNYKMYGEKHVLHWHIELSSIPCMPFRTDSSVTFELLLFAFYYSMLRLVRNIIIRAEAIEMYSVLLFRAVLLIPLQDKCAVIVRCKIHRRVSTGVRKTSMYTVLYMTQNARMRRKWNTHYVWRVVWPNLSISNTYSYKYENSTIRPHKSCHRRLHGIYFFVFTSFFALNIAKKIYNIFGFHKPCLHIQCFQRLWYAFRV